MRLIAFLAAMIVAGSAMAAETTKRPSGTVSPAAKTLSGKKAPAGTKGLTGIRASGVSALSDSDCINLQCDLKIMTSCATRVGCSCKGTGITICVDTIDPD